MVSGESVTSLRVQAFKSEQAPNTIVPSGTLLLDILKTLECQLQQRGFLVNPSLESIHPLWFVAEHERNTFLWRNGYSLQDKDGFEFWIDMSALAHKRISQLELLTEGFYFSNPTWGLAVPNEATIRKEIDYLESFLGAVSKIQRHVYALSKAGLLLMEEIRPSAQPRTMVTLPSATVS